MGASNSTPEQPSQPIQPIPPVQIPLEEQPIEMKIVNIATGQCLIARGLIVNGTPLVATDCGQSQIPFVYNPTNNVIGYGGKCLDVNQARYIGGQKVQLYDCNGQPNQKWIFGPNNSILTLGSKNYCLDLSSNGELIINIYTGSPNQQWKLLPFATPSPQPSSIPTPAQTTTIPAPMQIPTPVDQVVTHTQPIVPQPIIPQPVAPQITQPIATSPINKPAIPLLTKRSTIPKPINASDFVNYEMSCDANGMIGFTPMTDNDGFYYNYMCDPNKSFQLTRKETKPLSVDDLSSIIANRIDCNGKPISSVRAITTNDKNLYYEYQCGDDNLTDLATHETDPVNTTISNLSPLLDNQIKCNDGSLLSSYQLMATPNQNSDSYQYKYSYQCGKPNSSLQPESGLALTGKPTSVPTEGFSFMTGYNDEYYSPEEDDFISNQKTMGTDFMWLILLIIVLFVLIYYHRQIIQ